MNFHPGSSTPFSRHPSRELTEEPKRVADSGRGIPEETLIFTSKLDIAHW